MGGEAKGRERGKVTVRRRRLIGVRKGEGRGVRVRQRGRSDGQRIGRDAEGRGKGRESHERIRRISVVGGEGGTPEGKPRIQCLHSGTILLHQNKGGMFVRIFSYLPFRIDG